MRSLASWRLTSPAGIPGRFVPDAVLAHAFVGGTWRCRLRRPHQHFSAIQESIAASTDEYRLYPGPWLAPVCSGASGGPVTDLFRRQEPSRSRGSIGVPVVLSRRSGRPPREAAHQTHCPAGWPTRPRHPGNCVHQFPRIVKMQILWEGVDPVTAALPKFNGRNPRSPPSLMPPGSHPTSSVPTRSLAATPAARSASLYY